MIITFNPVTGSFIGKVTLSAPIKRIELLPFVNADNLHPLLVIDDSDKVSLFPLISTALLIILIDKNFFQSTIVFCNFQFFTHLFFHQMQPIN